MFTVCTPNSNRPLVPNCSSFIGELFWVIDFRVGKKSFLSPTQAGRLTQSLTRRRKKSSNKIPASTHSLFPFIPISVKSNFRENPPRLRQMRSKRFPPPASDPFEGEVDGEPSFVFSFLGHAPALLFLPTRSDFLIPFLFSVSV